MCKVLIVHAGEASEWAEYLKQILAASCNFLEGSIILYDVNQKTLAKNQELFSSCKCIIPLLSADFLEQEILYALRDLLQPSYKIVAFLCGISEQEISTDSFEHWEDWRKLSSEDEPSVYVSTVCECINDGCIGECYGQEIDDIQQEDQNIAQEPEDDDIQQEDQNIAQEPEDDFTFPDIPEFLALPDETDQENGHDVDSTEQSCISPFETPHEDQSCLTIQPERILCGTSVNIYMIMVKTFEDEDSLEVEFRSEHTTSKRIPAILVNKCIVTVQSPDMPAGIVSITLYKNESAVCSMTVKYFTEMEEICTYLKKVTDPMQFMCQAFDITSNVPESLDNLLVDSLNKQMPLGGLEVFGNSQISQDTTENCRDVELPTLLHFSAKYGLKKLASLLMQCPGALQAYSVMNKDGDYPNNLAEKSGFSDLRQFMDEYVETVDLVKTHMEESEDPSENDIYEDMLTGSQHFITEFENEDIYESMMKLNPEINLNEDLESILTDSSPEETMLRKFFEAKPGRCLQSQSTNDELPEMDDDEYHDMGVHPEIYYDVEEDPYNPCCPDQIYDTVEPHSINSPEVLNRPPAPIPRPVSKQEPEENTTYISKVFCPKDPVYSVSKRSEKDISSEPAQLGRDRDMSRHYDPFAGMKTPGQRQLISLQERVKVGDLTVEEAVQEFKAWQLDQDGRSHSVRFQQENLQRLRDSITRRCRDKGTTGMTELQITAPMQTNIHWGSNKNLNCIVYEPTPHTIAQPPAVSRPLQRGSWQTGSTSSTSSSSSHRLSIQSTVSNSSGPDGDCEEPPDIPLPPRPTRPLAPDIPPVLPPPRVPPRTTERNVDSALNERYVSRPSRPVPQMTPQRTMPPPPLPRRTW